MMYELHAMTTVLIRRTSLSRGIGTIQGTLVGAMIIGIVNNILNLANASPHCQQILKGATITAPVIRDVETKSVRTMD